MSIAQTCIEEMLSTYQKAQSDYETLKLELSKTEKAIEDVNHYIEFHDLNLALGYSAVQKLKDLRKLRRTIKNELEPLQSMLSMLNVSKLESVKHRIEKTIAHQSERIYTPRILKGGLSEASCE